MTKGQLLRQIRRVLTAMRLTPNREDAGIEEISKLISDYHAGLTPPQPEPPRGAVTAGRDRMERAGMNRAG